jgi:high-affinity iron transporter
MLATLVIGLREGLEAALIVGIIAAFLRRANKPLKAMWIGVIAAVTLSIAVGVVLQVISADLPQAQQEGMESIIGIIAVTIVTGMIGWMNRHARNMRSELEHSAEHALRDGTTWALVGMAFLAVLKEGFETSVFLLAAFQSASSPLTAGIGAVLGVAIAVAIGIGIYRGGVKINLGRFFRITGFFLVLVAAGLVLSSLRTAHEAGWIQIGQQTTVSLAWLAPNGSIQAALLTGVLGIPSDPRLIEVLGWFAYIVPVLLYLLWPVKRRPARDRLPALWLTIAGACVVAAIALASAVQLPPTFAPGAADLVASGGKPVGSATYDGASRTLTTSIAGTKSAHIVTRTTAEPRDGLSSRLWQSTTTTTLGDEPTTVTLGELIALAGGRLPIGISASQNPGPFAASWRSQSAMSAWFVGSAMIDGQSRSVTTVRLSGGGLESARTVSVSPPTAIPSWTVTTGYTDRTVAAISEANSQQAELLLWKLYLPILLVLIAVILGLYSVRARLTARRASRGSKPKTAPVRVTAHV